MAYRGVRAGSAADVSRHGETANDRLKRQWSVWWANGVLLAVALHVVVIALWPSMRIENFPVVAQAEASMRLMPPINEARLPPPPPPVARPATPVVASMPVDVDITIPPVHFDDWEPSSVPVPPTPAEMPSRVDFVAFTPRMVKPRVLNQPEVERALRRHYPAHLRASGIGGQTDLMLWLDEDGTILRAVVERSSGHEALDRAALKVIEIARVSPALDRNRPRRVTVRLPVVFRVDGG